MTKRKKRRSWGSITTITKTKHVLRWPENTPEGRKRKSYTFYGTYKEANLWLDMKHTELEQGKKNASIPTVGKVYKTWYLPQIEERLASGSLAKNTYMSFVRAFEHDIAPTWENVPVSEIKAIKVQDWISTFSLGNAKRNVLVFKSLLDIAMNLELVETNVLRRKYIMPNKVAVTNKDVYSYDDALNMLQKVHGQLFEAAFIVAGFGGARVGESLPINKDDLGLIEIEGQRFAKVSINKQLSQSDNVIENRLKTEQSERCTLVPFKYGGKRLFEIAEITDSQWLNDDLSGFPVGQKKLNYLWKKLAKDDYIPFANLRNSWRTFAQYTWGVDYDTLELLMGHKLPGITGTHYLRPSIEDLARSFANALNRFESI